MKYLLTVRLLKPGLQLIFEVGGKNNDKKKMLGLGSSHNAIFLILIVFATVPLFSQLYYEKMSIDMISGL